MYRQGHYGAALLAFAPVAFALSVAGRFDLAVVGGGLAVALAPLPDYDLRLPLVSHRGGTHTVAFALVVGSVLAAGGWLLARDASVSVATTASVLGFVAGTVSVGSHLLADAITPAGVTPLWPLSSKTYSLDLVRADNTLANYGLLAAGVFVSVALVVAFGPV